jgi:PAS domain S-box-containing protein
MLNRLHLQTASKVDELHFRLIVEGANNAILIVDAEGRVIYANPATELLFEYPFEAINNKPISILIPDYNWSWTQTKGDAKSHGYPKTLSGISWMCGFTKTGNQVPLEVTVKHYIIVEQDLFSIMLRDLSKQIPKHQFFNRVTAYATV